MSDAIRCGQCRWWHQLRDNIGQCELAPPQFCGGDPCDEDRWQQPFTDDIEGCSRGEPKRQPLTVSDGVPVAHGEMPVFRAVVTEATQPQTGET